MGDFAAGESIVIPVTAGQIEADLRVPDRATGLVIFAHGSGSSRFSSRNRSVAEALEGHGFGTLLLDLLTREEESVALGATEAEVRLRPEMRAKRAVLRQQAPRGR